MLSYQTCGHPNDGSYIKKNDVKEGTTLREYLISVDTMIEDTCKLIEVAADQLRILTINRSPKTVAL